MMKEQLSPAWFGRTAGSKDGRATAFAVVVTTVVLAVSAPAAGLDRVEPERHRVLSATHGEWTVFWHATTAEDRGQFRLYGGPSLDSLELVDVRPATRGPAGYRYRNGRTPVSGWYYQLRYITSEGRELVLGSLRVDVVGLQPSPASIVTLAPGGKALQAVAAPELVLSPEAGWMPADVPVADAPRPEPDVPPPRHLARHA